MLIINSTSTSIGKSPFYDLQKEQKEESDLRKYFPQEETNFLSSINNKKDSKSESPFKNIAQVESLNFIVEDFNTNARNTEEFSQKNSSSQEIQKNYNYKNPSSLREDPVSVSSKILTSQKKSIGNNSRAKSCNTLSTRDFSPRKPIKKEINIMSPIKKIPDISYISSNQNILDKLKEYLTQINTNDHKVVGNMQQEINKLQQGIEQERKFHKDSYEKIKSLTYEVQNLKNDNSLIQKKLDTYPQKIEREIEKAISDYKSENFFIKQQLINLQKDYDTVHSQKKIMLNEISLIEKEYNSFINNFTEEYNNLKNKYDNLDKLYNELNKINGTLQEKYNNLQKEYIEGAFSGSFGAAEEKKNEDNEFKIQELCVEIEILRSKLENLSASNKTLISEKKHLQNEINILHTKLENSEKSVQGYKPFQKVINKDTVHRNERRQGKYGNPDKKHKFEVSNLFDVADKYNLSSGHSSSHISSHILLTSPSNKRDDDEIKEAKIAKRQENFHQQDKEQNNKTKHKSKNCLSFFLDRIKNKNI